jgi:FKBP-type peptidyl-prolyl cis-trans isomerase
MILFTRLNYFLLRRFFLLTFIVALLGSCGEVYSEDDLVEIDKKIKNYIKKNNWKAEKSTSGLYLQILDTGKGPAIPIDAKILATYEGRLLNGQSFDKTGIQPVSLYTRSLIDGWREALLSMNIGDSARMIIPPNIGYKNQDLPKIPKNSILIFTIKIHGIE